jgi:hypothetical protein
MIIVRVGLVLRRVRFRIRVRVIFRVRVSVIIRLRPRTRFGLVLGLKLDVLLV